MHEGKWMWCITVITFVKLCISIEHCDLNPADNLLTTTTMKMIFDYASWRKLKDLIIFDPFSRRGQVSNNALQFINCLSLRDIYSTVYSTTVEYKKEFFNINRHRQGVIVLLQSNQNIGKDHVLIKASNNHLFDEHRSWLLITNDTHDFVVSKTLKNLALGLTTDLIVATSTQHVVNNINRNQLQCPDFLTPNITTNNTNSSPRHLRKYPKHKGTKKLSRTIRDISEVSDDFHNKIWRNNERDKVDFEVAQVYKIRRDNGNSIVSRILGVWGDTTHFVIKNHLVPVEQRTNLREFPLLVGFKNWTNSDTFTARVKLKQSETDVDDTNHLLEIMDFIAKSLNASVQLVPFTTIGTEVQEGQWSDLLGAVVMEQVDFGLEKVTVNYHKLDYMVFTHNILPSSRYIYMHPSELSVSKDIYLSPFSPKLLLCVLGMAILLAIVMLLSSAVAEFKSTRCNIAAESVNLPYAALWIVGILSMQGSIWSPITSSGNMTLISSLMFSLIIYNSYAAFITSILSVKTSDISSLDDLFDNGYQVGYIINSQDESYLQSQTSDLNKIYLYGFNSRVDEVEKGLLLAAQTKYALFVSTQVARRTLATLSPFECRCQVEEFHLDKTKENAAFPMNKYSPYKKIINLSVMKLTESGTLSRIRNLMLPGMPRCGAGTSFVSAQLEDVTTAIKLLISGILISIFILILECIVKYKRELRTCLRRKLINTCVKLEEGCLNCDI